MRVLLADDDEAMLRVLERYLRSWGYSLEIARNGHEAWQILKREDAPRIIILDWDMPGLTGLEVCRLVRSTAHGAGAYVLLLTGRLQKEDLVEALESGADDFITKPFDPRELQLRLAKGLRDTTRAGRAFERGPTLGAPPSGTTLGGKYRLERKIGEGGMGSVWLGVHLALRIDVAIKFMSPKLAEKAAYASFEREARAAAQLRSEHTVRVYDHGISEDGAPYLVMEYLQGESLTARVERQGCLEPGAVVAVVEQVARALTEAHARGIVHRDIKPDNILLVEDPERAHGLLAKLIDFGLAKPPPVGRPRGASVGSTPRLPAAASGSAPTGTVYVDEEAPAGGASEAARADAQLRAGTPIYMSPEALSDGSPPAATQDLWALAATSFFALTGDVPFYGESLQEVVRSVCQEPLPMPSRFHASLPRGVDAWFAKACARDPASRFASATELARALAEACGDARVIARSPGGPAGPRGVAPTEPERGR